MFSELSTSVKRKVVNLLGCQPIIVDGDGEDFASLQMFPGLLRGVSSYPDNEHPHNEVLQKEGSGAVRAIPPST